MSYKLFIGLALTILCACSDDTSSTKPSPEEPENASSSSIQENNSLSSSSITAIESSSSVEVTSSAEESMSSSEDFVLSSDSAPVSSSSKVTASNYDPVTGILTDERDGETYKTAKIGTQVWMGENLRFVVEKGENSCQHFDNDISDSIAKKFGRHYSWIAAAQLPCEYDTLWAFSGDNSIIKEPHQGICPSGWHIPTRDEWQTLLSTVPLQSILSTEWKKTLHGYEGTDDYGFSLNRGRFEVEDYQEFLILNERAIDKNYSIAIYHDENPVHLVTSPKFYSGAYLRCLMD
ncbi:FISUMP domain-containing protein [Fibrobacter sp. UWH4]|uniref:FISUMP domain-containing protein n=1 Tax=Fibrobacter sp. UWH4 TaxID=1896210 RepID=UPI00091419F8|nr:FISUMP domain-containing protein [Fibrobacter sp. UWH4]SHK88854.1 major paralogous domain-containing protein [Fibrobacter sp. UWH4]